MPVAVRLTNIAPMPDRLGSSRLTRNTEKLLPGCERDVVGLHVQHADVEAAGLAAQAGARLDRHQRAVVIEADAPAEEQIELLPFADREQSGVLQEERTLSRESAG